MPTHQVMAGYTPCLTVNPDVPELKHCLRQGDSGAMIGSLVEDLKGLGYWRGAVTNNFTNEVERAVRKFQTDYEVVPGRLESDRLAIDGVAGPATQLRICGARRGCKPGDDVSCYSGSPRIIVSCLQSYGGHPYSEVFPP